MCSRLKLFTEWGITFGKPYEIEEKSARKVEYTDRFELEAEIIRRNAAYASEQPIKNGGLQEAGGVQHATAIGTIAKELKLSRSTVKRAITDLEKSGRLSRE